MNTTPVASAHRIHLAMVMDRCLDVNHQRGYRASFHVHEEGLITLTTQVLTTRIKGVEKTITALIGHDTFESDLDEMSSHLERLLSGASS